MLAARRGGVRHRRRPDRPQPDAPGDGRGDAHRRRGQQVRLRLRAVEAQGARRARAPRHDPRTSPPSACTTSTPCSRRSSRSRPTLSTGSSAAPATSQPMPRIEEADDLDGGAGYPIITGDYAARAGVAACSRRRGRPGRQAGPGLHQARPGRRRRGARPARGVSAWTPPDHRPASTPTGRSATVMVLEALADDGVYVSQFVTGTSNGGLTAHAGGDRWRWESRLFGGRYDAADPTARPVYGALDDRGDAYGASPRFGSAHLRLATRGDRALVRSASPTPVFEPDAVGGPALIGELVALRDGRRARRTRRLRRGPRPRRLRLDRDVEALVLDPCFREHTVSAAADRMGCPVEWHPGWSVPRPGSTRTTADPRRRLAASLDRADP